MNVRARNPSSFDNLVLKLESSSFDNLVLKLESSSFEILCSFHYAMLLKSAN